MPYLDGVYLRVAVKPRANEIFIKCYCAVSDDKYFRSGEILMHRNIIYGLQDGFLHHRAHAKISNADDIADKCFITISIDGRTHLAYLIIERSQTDKAHLFFIALEEVEKYCFCKMDTMMR